MLESSHEQDTIHHIHDMEDCTNMTICIAAICEEGQAAVMIADRMLTHNTLSNYKEDDCRQKIHKFAENCYVLSSGDMPTANEILSLAHKDVCDIEDHFKIANAYIQQSNNLATESVLKIRGINSHAEYLERQKSLNDALVLKIDTELTKFNINTSIMTVFYSLSDKEYKMGLIENDKKYTNRTNPGFCSIGIEFRIAEYLMLKAGFTNKYTLDDTKRLLINLKQEFESHFDGIGKTHDLVCLRSGQVVESTI